MYALNWDMGKIIYIYKRQKIKKKTKTLNNKIEINKIKKKLNKIREKN